MTERRVPSGLALGLIAIVLVSLNLRPGASSPGPLLEEIRAGLDMSSALAGVFTGLPGLCFGLVGMVAVTLARRVGTTGGITIGLAAAALGLILRAGTGNEWIFLGLSVIALGGMALGNVLVPAWIKTHERGQVLLQTIYGTGLMVGGALGAAFAAPAADALGGWRPSLRLWGWAILAAIPFWAYLALREHNLPDDHRRPMVAPNLGLLASPTTVALTLMFGIQSMHAYVQFGWLPQIYRDAGLSAGYAGALMSSISGIGLLGALAMPSIIARGHHLRAIFASFGISLIAGYAGLLLAPATLPWVWSTLLALSGFAFPTAIALITARTRTPAVTAQVSGFVQPVGYLLAAIGPVLVGLLHAATGDWRLVLIVLAATGIPLSWASVKLAAGAYVDDELR